MFCNTLFCVVLTLTVFQKSQQKARVDIYIMKIKIEKDWNLFVFSFLIIKILRIHSVYESF